MKNSVKFLVRWATVCVALVMMAGITSCEKEKDNDPRDAFVGTFTTRMEFVYQGLRYTVDYTLSVTKSLTNENDIIMNNISNSNVAARATVSGNAVTIPQQTFVSYGISGSGTVNGNVLTFSTQETDTDFVGAINVNHTATKQ